MHEARAVSCTGLVWLLSCAGLTVAQDVSIVAPAFMWAQGPDTVFLRVKWASEMKKFGAKLRYRPELHFDEHRMLVLASSVDKTTEFHLNLHFWDAIDARNVTTPGGDGMVHGAWTLHLAKATKGRKWNSLLHDDASKPGNMKVWWEMQQMEQDALDRLEMDEDELRDSQPQDLVRGFGVDSTDDLREKIEQGGAPRSFIAEDVREEYEAAQRKNRAAQDKAKEDVKKMSPKQYALAAEKKDKAHEKMMAGALQFEFPLGDASKQKVEEEKRRAKNRKRKRTGKKGQRAKRTSPASSGSNGAAKEEL